MAESGSPRGRGQGRVTSATDGRLRPPDGCCGACWAYTGTKVTGRLYAIHEVGDPNPLPLAGSYRRLCGRHAFEEAADLADCWPAARLVCVENVIDALAG
jgi:hypothetical protein